MKNVMAVVVAVVVLGLGSVAVGEEVPADLGARIEKMTGARTKIVWVHQVAGKAKGWDAMTAEYELKGLDTAEGRARVILPGPKSFQNPCLSPDGRLLRGYKRRVLMVFGSSRR